MASCLLSTTPSRVPICTRTLLAPTRKLRSRRWLEGMHRRSLWIRSCHGQSPAAGIQRKIPRNDTFCTRVRRRTPNLTSCCPCTFSTTSDGSNNKNLDLGNSTVSATSSSVYYDDNEPWEEWFPSEEYENPWNSVSLAPLDHIVWDNQSRFILQLLRDMFNISLTRRGDRITTERCNAMIKKLLDDSNFILDGDNRGAAQPSHLIEQRALRAHAILRSMELFLPLQERYQNVKLPVALPVPNHETYWNVLKLYASRFLHGDRDIPLTCLAIVERMEELYLSSSSMSSPLVKKHRSELKPGVLHYNLVLCAWGNSKDPRRPLEAAKLLQQLEAKEAGGAGKLTDASSYGHTLRACLSLEQRGQRMTTEFKELAPEVAVRIWTVLLEKLDLQEEQRRQQTATEGDEGDDSGQTETESETPPSVVLNSHLFVHFLRACRNFTNVRSRRDAVVGKTFRDCCERGLVNPHVLQEFLNLASPNLVEDILGKYHLDASAFESKEARRMRTKHDTQRKYNPLLLIRKVPPHWIENADGNKYDW